MFGVFSDKLNFDKKEHIYSVGEKQYLSVTKFVKSFFKPFIFEDVIRKMRNGKKWSSHPCFGMNDEEIKNFWNNNTELGTLLHQDIENYFKFHKIPEKKEFKYFLDFHSKMKQDGYDIRFCEISICDHENEIAGTVDAIYSNGKDNILVDWKRIKELKKDEYPDNKGFKCISHIFSNQINDYSLQQNLYKYILEKNGIVISKMLLVCLHPDNQTYKEEEPKDFTTEIIKMLKVKNKEKNSPTVNFGKYKGRKADDLMADTSYLSWCMKTPDIIRQNKNVFDYINSCDVNSLS